MDAVMQEDDVIRLAGYAWRAYSHLTPSEIHLLYFPFSLLLDPLLLAPVVNSQLTFWDYSSQPSCNLA